MSNIPLIHQNRISASRQPRRTNRVKASEFTDGNTLIVNKRQNGDRRQHRVKVIFDRRQRSISRRKSLSSRQVTTNSTNLSTNRKGTHINITA